MALLRFAKLNVGCASLLFYSVSHVRERHHDGGFDHQSRPAVLTYLVGTNLVQNPWDVDTLDGLLSFRSRVGHSAAFADSVSFPSLISRVCDRWQFAFRHDTNNSRRGFEAVLGNRYHDPFHCWLSDLYGGTYSMDFHCSQITCRKSLLHVEHLAHSNAIVNTGRL